MIRDAEIRRLARMAGVAEEEFDDVWNTVSAYVGRIATAVP